MADDGSIIMQIGPDNVHEITMLMSEVFGKDNHICTIPYITAPMQAKYLGEISNWLVWYGKDKTQTKYHQMYVTEELDHYAQWSNAGVRNPQGERRPMTVEEVRTPQSIPNGWEIYRGITVASARVSKTGRSDTYYHHENGEPCPNPGWSAADRERAKNLGRNPDHVGDVAASDLLLPDDWYDHTCSDACHSVEGNRRCPKGRKCGPKCDANAVPCPTGRHWRVSLAGLHSIAAQGRLFFKGNALLSQHLQSEHPGRTIGAVWLDAGRTKDRQYVVETPPRVLERCILMTTDPGDLVLDLTCGSGAMPVQCENWGRRWIAVDVSAVSISIARERISITTYKNHVLRDSEKGHKADHERRMALLPPTDPRRHQPFKYEDPYRNDPSKGFVNERQVRVSAATLAYGPDLSEGSKDIIVHPDRTLEDNSKVRVAGPFTVESDSPYRAATPDEVIAEAEQPTSQPATDIQARIIEHLSKAPIQMDNGEYRLENIQPAPEYNAITHTATAVFGPEDRRDVAVYVAREDEIISAARTRNAANLLQNNRALGQRLIMVGFGQDADAASMHRFFPALDIDIVIANRDLQLQHLKDDDKSRPFTVVSEPDVQVNQHPDGKISIELLGINAFNGAKRQVESKPNLRWLSMMIDPDYDGDRFRAGLMNVQPSKRKNRILRQLKSAFGNEIDDAKFKQMQMPESLPFTPGERVAVKVIDQTGMEHMTVFDNDEGPGWH